MAENSFTEVYAKELVVAIIVALDRESGFDGNIPQGLIIWIFKKVDIFRHLRNSGKVVDGNRAPSSEFHNMHLAVYDTSDAAAVVHAQFMHCTTFVMYGTNPIKAIHYGYWFSAHTHLIPVVPYATYGSLELA